MTRRIPLRELSVSGRTIEAGAFIVLGWRRPIATLANGG